MRVTKIWGILVLKHYSLANQRHIRLTVALLLVFAVVFVSLPLTLAAPDQPSVQWSTSFDWLQATSVIEPSIGGYAIAGKTSSYGGDTFIEATEYYKPNMIADYANVLADKFNTFYNAYPVIKADSQELSDARISLTEAIQTVLHNGLTLIGVVAPEKM